MTGASAPPPVDLVAFRAAMREAGIEEIVEPTLQLWVQEAPGKFELLQAAVSASDVRAAASAAHALRSSSSVICANAFVEALTALEIAGHAGDRDRVAALFEDVRPRYQEAFAYLKAVA
jgi:HPt (histidine-containing phosphotransfer) domain-containing protein